MGAQITTRSFRISDYEAAVELWTRVPGVEISEGDAREDISLYLKRNPDLSRVAEDRGRLIGAALCGEDGRRGYIYHLAIDPDYQQQGLARRLVSECLERLAAKGLQRALIIVADDNPRGRAFWERCGWEEVSGTKLMGIDLR
jgi:ribosomal protein S18 acetylase RimI-like enzyme